MSVLKKYLVGKDCSVVVVAPHSTDVPEGFEVKYICDQE